MGDEYDVIFLTNVQLAFICHWVEGRYIAFNYFPANFWLSACIQFFQKMCGEGCRIFRILCFHARFMLILSFLEITCQPYISFFLFFVIFDCGLVDNPFLVTMKTWLFRVFDQFPKPLDSTILMQETYILDSGPFNEWHRTYKVINAGVGGRQQNFPCGQMMPDLV